MIKVAETISVKQKNLKIQYCKRKYVKLGLIGIKD